MALALLKQFLVSVIVGVVFIELNNKVAGELISTNLTVTFKNSDLERFPEDLGGNFGDTIHHERHEGDKLLWREVLVNDIYYINNTDFDYRNYLKDANYTTVRAFNLGRQRAFVRIIATDNVYGTGLMRIFGTIKGRTQMRLLIEAYGY